MRRATVLLGIVFALAASLMTANPANADSSYVSPSDQHALNYINQQPATRVNILLNAKATHWYASHTKNAFQYLGFGWYTVRVTKAQARFVFASLPDGWVNPNHSYHVASDSKVTQGVRGPSNSPEVADFSTIIGAKNVNNDGNRGAGQTVAIIDTGIYESHPFFKNTAGTASRIVACLLYTSDAADD